VEFKPASRSLIEARLGRPWEEVARQVDAHTMAVQAWLPTRAPEAARFDGVGVTAGSSGIPVRLLNLALGSDYPPGTGGEEISAEIEAVKAFFAQRDVPWYWWIGPYPRPPDVAERLGRHGLSLDPPSLPAMVAPLPVPFPEIDHETQVWLASSVADLEAASTIRRVAFGFPDGAAVDYFEAMGDDWLAGDPARLYLARLGSGPPAAVGALIIGFGIPGVYVMATLPQWGRRGLGKAILARMLADATGDGHTLIALTAGTKGYPLYRQFGFEHVFDYAIYRLVRED
jgi:GNAT superfamily N-acetyltransferase